MQRLPRLQYWLWSAAIIVVSLVRFHNGHFLVIWEDCVSVLTYSILFPFTLWFAHKSKYTIPSNLKYIASGLALFFSTITVLGRNYYYFYNWNDSFGGVRATTLTLLQIATYFACFYQIIAWLLAKIESFSFGEERRPIDVKKWTKIIFCIKGFFFILFFPCLFDFDAALGLRTFLDPNSATCDHHPIFVEAVHAFFFSLGNYLHNPTIGITLLSVSFIVLSTSIDIYSIKIVQKTSISHKGLVIFASILSFFPFFPILSLLPTKDGFFAYSLLLYILCVFEVFQTNGECLNSKKHLLIYSIASLSVCLTRHQGTTIILLNSIALLLYYKKHWVKVVKLVVPSLASAIIITKLFFPILNIEPGGKQELLGTLFQQTAYCLKLHPKDITQQESDAINTILNIETIANRYKIHVTDPVKNEYIYNPRYIESNAGPRKFQHIDHTNESQDLKNYLSAWITMGARHPSAYIQATSAIALGFFFNSKKALIDIYSEGFYNPQANSKEYLFWKVDCIYQSYYKCRKTITSIPVINWITAIPYYIWATIILLTVLFYRKDIQGIIIFLPIILSIGVLIICPVINGRYMYPIVIALPLLLFYCLLCNRTNKSSNK